MTIQDWLGEDNKLGIDIWKKKYEHNNEGFEAWLDRVSGGNEEVKKIIREKKFLFGGRILSNRGLSSNDRKVSYSNCYVIKAPEDSLDEIFETSKNMAITYSRGGGVGIDISKLAPKGARVRNAADESSGAVSFMDLYSTTTGLIGQNGRRGALMISMDCTHPDVEEFIDVKRDLDKVTKANISIRFNDDFMRAALNDEQYELNFERAATGETISKTVNAKDIVHKVASANWDMGEPGALFWDRITQYNLLQNTKQFAFAGVNPCGEEPLPEFGACLLGSINLSEFVRRPFSYTACINWSELGETVRIATRALNDVQEEGIPLHPLKEQQECAERWKQIGLGIFGASDMLIKLGIKYDTQMGIEACGKIAQFIFNEAAKESAILAKERGTYADFNYDEVCATDFYKNNVSPDTDNLIRQYGLRNSQLLTIAPTGTLSTMLGVSGGVEPIFANSYTRTTKSLHGDKDVDYKVYTPIVKQYMELYDLTDESELPAYFVTAGTIDPIQRVHMQAAWQNSIDASISSTVNLPNSATIEDIENIYMEAWKMGLKGITVFRDGCDRVGILTTGETQQTPEVKVEPAELPRGAIIECSYDLVGKKRKLTTGCGTLHCLAFFDPITGELMETYLGKGSTGGCDNTLTGLSRMISLAARAGCSIEDIVDQLDSTGTCPSYATRRALHKDTSKGSCCPMAVGRALLEMYEEMQSELRCDEEPDDEEIVKFYADGKEVMELTIPKSTNVCPECGEPLFFEGGCNTCKSCGWSKCS